MGEGSSLSTFQAAAAERARCRGRVGVPWGCPNLTSAQDKFLGLLLGEEWHETGLVGCPVPTSVALVNTVLPPAFTVWLK